MLGEIWKDVTGYEGIYQVSNMGRVKRLEKRTRTWSGYKTWKEIILKPIVQHTGYAHIGLWDKGKQKQVRLHRLVAMAFCENYDPLHKTHINHLNEDKLDNRACNLEWVTAKENTNYGGCIARRIYGRIKSVECIDGDGNIVRSFKSQADANAWCSVSRNDGHIAACCRGHQKTAYGYRWQYAHQAQQGGDAR